MSWQIVLPLPFIFDILFSCWKSALIQPQHKKGAFLNLLIIECRFNFLFYLKYSNLSLTGILRSILDLQLLSQILSTASARKIRLVSFFFSSSCGLLSYFLLFYNCCCKISSPILLEISTLVSPKGLPYLIAYPHFTVMTLYPSFLLLSTFLLDRSPSNNWILALEQETSDHVCIINSSKEK